ncbi:MAG: fluoride efflux transporter CrcB [Alphaproteobacteria bacterium]|nr:MAG: fluoride efflux transporter CrcB [Alphaproteobacteria bacterium]
MGPYLIVFAGAGLGGMLRHGLNGLSLRLFGPDLPIGTPVINVLGSFLMGLLGGWFLLRSGSSLGWRLFLTTGVLGGFTTFSTFSLEAALLWERGALGQAALYVVGSVGLGVLALFGGLALVRSFSPV